MSACFDAERFERQGDKIPASPAQVWGFEGCLSAARSSVLWCRREFQDRPDTNRLTKGAECSKGD